MQGNHPLRFVHPTSEQVHIKPYSLKKISNFCLHNNPASRHPFVAFCTVAPLLCVVAEILISQRIFKMRIRSKCQSEELWTIFLCIYFKSNSYFNKCFHSKSCSIYIIFTIELESKALILYRGFFYTEAGWWLIVALLKCLKIIVISVYLVVFSSN